jgi:hypothetical protein
MTMPAKIQLAESKANVALRSALSHARHGWPIFPLWPRDGHKCTCGDPGCKSQGKHPIGRLVPNGFKDATTNEKTITLWWQEYPDAGIGMPTGTESGIDVLDIDVKSGKDGTLPLSNLFRDLGALPETQCALTPSGGKHLYFRHAEGIRCSTDKLGVGLDVRGDGGYVVLPPSHGGLYKWDKWVREGEGYVNHMAELPEAWVEHLRSLSAPPAASDPLPAADPKVVAAALAVIPNGADVGWGDWNRVGMATFRATGGSADGFRAFDAWSAKWPAYDAGYTRNRWETYRRSPPNRIGAGTVFHLADKASPGWRDKEKAKEKAGNAIRQTDILIELAAAAELFHTDDGKGYADILVNAHRETWLIGSTGFREWLRHRYYKDVGGAPTAEALRTAIEQVSARARFDAPMRRVYVRVGGQEGKIYLDLADETRRVVQIDGEGWGVVDNPPVRFLRVKGMLPLPVPVKGGSVDTLRSFVNVKRDTDFVLMMSWLLAALRDCGPYPILKVWGEPGSAKSTMVDVLRALIDPNKASRRRFPREDRDLFIAAGNAHVLSYDNISHVPDWLSNSLCTLATGGSYATRTLYTNQEEELFEATRPVILNGIENFIMKHDLADRTIVLELKPIPEGSRRLESELKTKFEAARPQILGALLDAVAHGIRMLPMTRSEGWPRMADFAHWVTACERALWPEGTFRDAYDGNRWKATQGAHR